MKLNLGCGNHRIDRFLGVDDEKLGGLRLFVI
jgi:hypothetical protein